MPYYGEIRMFAGNFAPRGWMFCQGQILPIAGNDNLFTLIGTTYGGDGETTFMLPNLQGRIPLHMGTGGGASYVLGENGGTESVTVTSNQMPSHSHPFLADAGLVNGNTPANNLIGQSAAFQMYIQQAPSTPLAANALTPDGGSQPHSNFQPYLCVNFIIAIDGIFPTQN